MTNSRLLLKLNKYAKESDTKESQNRKSQSRDKMKQTCNLEYHHDDIKSTRKSLEPTYSR